MYIGSYIIYIHIYTELYIHTHTYIQGCVNIWASVYNIYTHMYKSMYSTGGCDGAHSVGGCDAAQAWAAATAHIAWPRGATPHPRSGQRPGGATPRPRSGGCGGTGGPTGAIPRSRSGGAAVRRYPSSKVRSSGCALLEQREEIPHIQGKRNPSKMVGVARGHQRADTLKP